MSRLCSSCDPDSSRGRPRIRTGRPTRVGLKAGSRRFARMPTTPASGRKAAPDSWLPDGVTRDELRASLRPLLDLPVELILPTHGDPITDGAPGALQAAIEG